MKLCGEQGDGLAIKSVKSGSIAQQSGIYNDAVIISINGHATQNMGTYVRN